MATPGDLEFVQYLVDRHILDADRANRALKSLQALEKRGIRRTAADLVVEAGWVDVGTLAGALLEARKGGRSFPDSKPRRPADADTAALAKLPPERQRDLGELSAELKILGYARSVAALAGDLAVGGAGLLKVAAPAGEPKLRVKESGGTQRRPATARDGGTARRPAPAAPAPEAADAPLPVRKPTLRKWKQRAIGFGWLAGMAIAVLILVKFFILKEGPGGAGPQASTSPEFKYIPPDEDGSGRSPRPTPPSPKPTPRELTAEELAEQKRKFIAEQEEAAAKTFADAKKLLELQNYVPAKKKFVLLRDSLGWTEFVKKNLDAITQHLKDLEAHVGTGFPGPGPGPGPDPGPIDSPGRSAYEERLGAKTEEGLRRADAARKAVEADSAADAKRSKAVKAKLKDSRLDVSLWSGLTVKGAAILDLTRDDVRIVGAGPEGPVDLLVAWEAFDDASFLAVHRAIAKAMGPEGLLDLGRAAASRRLWKDAQAAFADAVKADAKLKDRVPDYGAVLSDPQALRGRATPAARDVLQVCYDGADPEALRDFVEIVGAGGKIDSGASGFKLTPKGATLWALRDVGIAGEVEIDAVVSGEGRFAVGVPFDALGKGPLLTVGSEGVKLHRWDRADKGAIAEAAGVSGETRVRIHVQRGIWRVRAGGREVLSGVWTESGSGLLVVGALDRPVIVKKLWIAARVAPGEIARRFRTHEAAMHPGAPTTDVVSPLSVEDEFYKLPAAVQADYDRARARALAAWREGGLDPALGEILDRIVQAAPEYPAARFCRAAWRWASGLRAEAKRDLTAATVRNPEFAEARALLAAACLEDGDIEGAMTHASEALKRRPDLGAALAVQGQARFAQGDTRLAQVDLDLAARLTAADDIETWMRIRGVQALIRGPGAFAGKPARETARYAIFADGPKTSAESHAARLDAAFNSCAELLKGAWKDELAGPKVRVTVFSTRESFAAWMAATGRGGIGAAVFDPLHRDAAVLDPVDPGEPPEALGRLAAAHFVSCFSGGVPAMLAPLVNALGAPEKNRLPSGVLAGMRAASPSADSLRRPSETSLLEGWAVAQFLLYGEGGAHRKAVEKMLGELLNGKEPQAAVEAGLSGLETRIPDGVRSHLGTVEDSP